MQPLNALQIYKGFSFLIVDDFAEFRYSLKQMVESFGAGHVELAVSAEAAIASYGEHFHDFLLVDYNLGDGLTGLQLLEELTLKSLLKHGTVFVLLTGETTLDQVMGALEYRPDDYLAKPFTRNVLKQRLDKLVTLNTQLKPVYQALNNGKPNTALDYCDKLVAENPRLAITCLRLKANILLKNNDYRKAAKIYQSICQAREVNWALLGLARCYNGFGDATKAIEICERIISKTANAIDAYDLVSECYINLGMFEKAYDATKKAIEYSPNSIPRQRRLAKLCLRYKEYDAAYNACKKLQALGNYSSLVQVEDCVLWLICASYLMYAKPSSRTISITREISQIYRQIEKYDAVQANLAVELHKAYHQYRLKPEEFEQNQLEKIIENVVGLPDPLKPYLVDLLVLLESLLDDNPIKISLAKATEAAKSQLYTQDNQNRAIDYNKSGQLKYAKKEYRAAYDAFRVAFQNAPDNPNIALNLLQTSYKLLGSKDFTFSIEMFSLCKQTLSQLAPSDHRYEQSKTLLLHIETKLMSNLQ